MNKAQASDRASALAKVYEYLLSLPASKEKPAVEAANSEAAKKKTNVTGR